MTEEAKGFTAFQIRKQDVTFTISKSNWDMVQVDLESLGLTDEEIDQLRDKLGDSFRALLAPEPPPAAQNTSGQTNTYRGGGNSGGGGFRGQEYGPKCGHGVDTIKRKGPRGEFWACQAKAPDGTFYWKLGEGCRPVNI